MTTATAPKTIKVSSKRQITIPSDSYKRLGFTSYAYLEERDGGLFIRPVEVLDESNAVDILRQLVEEGYEGERLIREFEARQPEVMELSRLLDEAERDIAAGRVMAYDEHRRRMDVELDSLDARYGM